MRYSKGPLRRGATQKRRFSLFFLASSLLQSRFTFSGDSNKWPGVIHHVSPVLVCNSASPWVLYLPVNRPFFTRPYFSDSHSLYHAIACTLRLVAQMKTAPKVFASSGLSSCTIFMFFCNFSYWCRIFLRSSPGNPQKTRL